MKQQEYGELEHEILRLLEERPRSSNAIAKIMGLNKTDANNVLKRLKYHGRVYNHGGRWHWLADPLTKDNSPFPAPPYETKCVGWWG